jgi:hypothetical protein
MDSNGKNNPYNKWLDDRDEGFGVINTTPLISRLI